MTSSGTHIGILIQHEEQPVGAGVNDIAVQLLQHVQQHLLVEKSRIRETLNLSTDVDHTTNIWGRGVVMVKKHVTCDM